MAAGGELETDQPLINMINIGKQMRENERNNEFFVFDNNSSIVILPASLRNGLGLSYTAKPYPQVKKLMQSPGNGIPGCA